MDMGYGTWNVQGLNRTGSLTVIVSKVAKYKILMAVQEVKWDKVGSEPPGNYKFFHTEMRILIIT
jgi:hypothetical protein